MSRHHKMYLCVGLPSMIGAMILMHKVYLNLSLAEELHIHPPEERLLAMIHLLHSQGMDTCANLYARSVAGDEHSCNNL